MSPARNKRRKARLSRSGAMSTMMRPGIPPPYGVPGRPRRRLAKSPPARGDATHRPIAGREGGGRGARAQLAETGGGARRAPPRGGHRRLGRRRGIFGTACPSSRRGSIPKRRTSRSRTASTEAPPARPRAPATRALARRRPGARRRPLQRLLPPPRHHVAQGSRPSSMRWAEAPGSTAGAAGAPARPRSNLPGSARKRVAQWSEQK